MKSIFVFTFIFSAKNIKVTDMKLPYRLPCKKSLAHLWSEINKISFAKKCIGFYTYFFMES